MLITIESIVRHGLGNPHLADRLCHLVRPLSKERVSRREAFKTPPNHDDIFVVALKLVEMSTQPNLTDKARALLLRDAALFGVLGLHSPRCSVLAGLQMGESIRFGENRAAHICVNREQTKPGVRDMLLELPPEIMPLICEYAFRSRVVLGCAPSSGPFFAKSGGGALSASAIASIVRTRAKQVLARTANPHLIRKSWATEYARWSHGDWLSASHVLDSSAETIQRSYSHVSDRELIDNFDIDLALAWDAAGTGSTNVQTPEGEAGQLSLKDDIQGLQPEEGHDDQR